MDEILDDKSTAQISEDISIEKNRAVFPFQNHSVETVASRVNEMLIEKGYKLENGSLINATYGKGSVILRVLFGAFAKRFCWTIKVEKVGDFTQLTFVTEAKGYVGGIVGVTQVQNEYKRLTNAFTVLHSEMKA